MALAATLFRYYLRARQSADATWEDILNRLAPVDRDAIATIALDAVTELGEARPLEDGFALDIQPSGECVSADRRRGRNTVEVKPVPGAMEGGLSIVLELHLKSQP